MNKQPPGTVYPRERLREKPRATVQQVQEKISQLPGASLGGYMPLRGDFDVSCGWFIICATHTHETQLLPRLLLPRLLPR